MHHSSPLRLKAETMTGWVAVFFSSATATLNFLLLMFPLKGAGIKSAGEQDGEEDK